ncbi:MAG: penicillin acylase family protein, partial [Chloroflexi bacterium]|nr:penicillin acylase family protein [Chloroflexota bacterium]
GTWSSGHRALRIRQMLEAQEKFSFADFIRMQHDVLSMRAVEGAPRLIAALREVNDERVQRAVEYLRVWDGRMETDSVGASLFDIFFNYWSQAVAHARFAGDVANLMAGAVGGLSLELLAEDHHGWFADGERGEAIRAAFMQTLDDHTRRLGSDLAQWTWGRSHTIALRHTLAARGELGVLLNRGGVPVRGNGVTVCNTGYDPNYMASIGANYRLIADLSTSPPSLYAVDAAGESGHPGSAHYGDQLNEWMSGRYHSLPLRFDKR